MFKFKVQINIFFIFAVIALLIGCSTEKDAALNVGYHNMTARFNGYFNAGEIIDQSVDSYRASFKDDYNNILQLQVFPGETDASSIFPDMDLAIEKCSKVIFRHAMPNPNVVSNKDEEHCRWIDDNWFLIGKSHFLKREYVLAEEKFKYIKREYENESSLYAAEIWLARIYIEQDNLTAAKLELVKVKNQLEEYDKNKKSLTDFIKKDDSNSKKSSKYQKKKERRERKKSKKESDETAKFSDNLKVDYQVTMAELYIKEEDYKKAAEHLILAVELLPRGKEKARYQFILGQLYQEIGNPKSAELYFQKVIKSNAPYEMRFYAKINKTLSATSGSLELREDLFKMLKDYKNEEYKDQIYFVLAELDLKDGDRKGAISNLTKSAIYSVNNNQQKAKTYLKLADMHFEDKLYIKSQKYYDSCVTVLPKEHKDFTRIENKAKSLFKLVENYEIYVKEDSVQALVELPEKELEKELKRILKDIKEKERLRKLEEQRRLLAKQNSVSNAAIINGSGSKWYFYNQKSRDRGYNDFKYEWSNRILEDDWRRSTKQSITSFNDNDTAAEVEIKIDSLTVENLREGLPLNEADLKASKDRLIIATYNLGMIYKNQLEEEGEASDYFNQILGKEYNHEKVLPAAYQLYLIHQKTDKPKAQKYKDYILLNFPESDIAKLLNDPQYFIKKEQLERKDLDDYKAVLRDYEYKRYISVISQCNLVINNDSENKYINKYYLLKANSISQTGIGGIEAILGPLEELYANSPDSEEGRTAKAYIAKLNGTTETDEANDANKPKFKYDQNEKHYFAVLVPIDKESEVNDIKIKIANFNSSYFQSDNLTITNTILGETHQIIVIKSFVNVSKTATYTKAYNSAPAKSLLNNVSEDYEGFMLSRTNYSFLLSTKDLAGYKAFYKENY